jgi:hypothetical protein
MADRTPIDPEKQFVVALTGQKVTWGPFADRGEAGEFAEFVTHEIDPAEVRTLSSPAAELLAWRKAMEQMEQEMNRG